MNTIAEAQEIINGHVAELNARKVIARKVGMSEHSDDWPASAWPGCYSIAYVCDDGEMLCSDCVDTQESVHFAGEHDGWCIIGVDAFGATADYPEYDVFCTHCRAVICEAL